MVTRTPISDADLRNLLTLLGKGHCSEHYKPAVAFGRKYKGAVPCLQCWECFDGARDRGANVVRFVRPE